MAGLATRYLVGICVEYTGTIRLTVLALYSPMYVFVKRSMKVYCTVTGVHNMGAPKQNSLHTVVTGTYLWFSKK